MKFLDYKKNYIDFLKKNNLLVASNLLIEIQVESLKEWGNESVDDVLHWYNGVKNRSTMTVKEIPLKDCDNWSFSLDNKDIFHNTKKFFSIIGIRVSSTEREVGSQGWSQPIIKESNFDGGIVGLIRKRINDIPYYLVEAKAEPGNYNLIQISPCLQATFSNIQQFHGGRKPYFVDYFLNPEKNNARLLFEQWMSEDGGRLYKKMLKM
jgi:oxidase EvaA